MSIFKTTTGFGFIQGSNGNIITKCVLFPGEHAIKEGFTFVEVNSQAELDAIATSMTLTLSELADRKVMEAKSDAARRINVFAPDYKVLRHREQIELSLPTTLAAAEYESMIQLRQAIREASNTIEAEIRAITELGLLEAFSVSSHPSWPVI